MYVQYEKRGEAFVMLWYHKTCDTLVLEKWLGGGDRNGDRGPGSDVWVPGEGL